VTHLNIRLLYACTDTKLDQQVRATPYSTASVLGGGIAPSIRVGVARAPAAPGSRASVRRLHGDAVYTRACLPFAPVLYVCGAATEVKVYEI